MVISIFDRFVGVTSFLLLTILIIFYWFFHPENELIFDKFINNFKTLRLSFFLIPLLIFFIFILIKKILKKYVFIKILNGLFFKVFCIALLSHMANVIATIYLISEISNLKFLQNAVVVSISLFGNFFPFTPSGLGITELIFQEILHLFKNSKGFELGIKLRIVSFYLILFLSIMTCVMYVFKLIKK